MTNRTLARLEAELISGIHPDVPNALVPFWSEGANIVFDKHGPRPVRGLKLALDTGLLSPILGIITAKVAAGNRTFFGTADKIYMWDGTNAPTEVGTGYSASYWVFAQWGNWILATSGGKIQIWKGTTFAEMATSPTGVQFIIPFKQYMVAFQDRTILGSHSDDVELWIPARDNEAVELPVRDIDGPIVSAVPHPQGIIFYGTNSAHLLSYVGPPFILGQRRIADGIGALGPHSVLNIEGTHFGASPNGIFVFSMSEGYRFIDDPSIRAYMFDALSQEHKSKTAAWYDPTQNLLMISYPTGETTEYNERSIGYSIGTQGWSPMQFAATAVAQPNIFQYPLCGEADGNLYWHGVEGGSDLPTGTQRILGLEDELIFGAGYGNFGYGETGYGE
jgi:hypothetical protein